MNKVRLGDVCSVERGASPRPINKYITTDSNGINWIKIGDTNSSKYITNTEQKITPEGAKKSRFVKKGDFLLSNSMSFGRPYILKIDGCIHDGWLVLHDISNSFEADYLYHYLSSPSMYNRFKNLAVGGVVNNLNSSMVKDLLIEIPPIDEQRKIADIFDVVDSLLLNENMRLEKLDELIKSRFVEMFGDSQYSLQELIDLIISGAGLSYGIVQPGDDNTGDMGVLRPVDIIDGAISTASIKYINREIANGYQKTELLGKELLITVRGTTGITALTDKRFLGMNVTRGIAVIRYDEKIVNPIYLNSYFKTEKSQRYISEHTRGATLKQINLSDLRKQQILVPPLELQNQFADFVTQVEKQKATVQQSIDKLETLKKSLMQEYFG